MQSTAWRLPPVMTLPGSAVGAGGALTVGVNEFAPPGPTFFSVGEGAGALVLVDGVVLGASFSLLPQALRAPIPTMARPRKKCDLTSHDLSSFSSPNLRAGK